MNQIILGIIVIIFPLFILYTYLKIFKIYWDGVQNY